MGNYRTGLGYKERSCRDCGVSRSGVPSLEGEKLAGDASTGIFEDLRLLRSIFPDSIQDYRRNLWGQIQKHLACR